MDYWKECISEALEDAGLKATDKQIEDIAGWIEGAHDNYSQAHGHDVMHSGPNPLEIENKMLKEKISTEDRKSRCEDCQGFGFIRSHGPSHYSDSTCDNCKGSGRAFK